jgi:hypothetical protein
MNNCIHNVKGWDESSLEDLENTILKPKAMSDIYGKGLKVRSVYCSDCNKTVIEITSEGRE